jgi:hypothetical protein
MALLGVLLEVVSECDSEICYEDNDNILAVGHEICYEDNDNILAAGYERTMTIYWQ